jgi:hypothetical protein
MVKTFFHVSSAVANDIVLVVCYVILLVTKVHSKFSHIHNCHHGALVIHAIHWRFGLILYRLCYLLNFLVYSVCCS